MNLLAPAQAALLADALLAEYGTAFRSQYTTRRVSHACNPGAPA